MRTRAGFLDFVVVLVLLVGGFVGYAASNFAPQMCDSCYSMAVSQTLIDEGSISLTRHIPQQPERLEKLPGYEATNRLPYHLARSPKAGLVYRFGYGTSFLSLPFVLAFNRVRGLTPFDPDGMYNVDREARLQKWIAAFVAAATNGATYLTARYLLAPGPALLVTLGFGLASSNWSSLSRSLWAQTWTALLVSLVILILARLELRGPAGDRHGVALGTLFFWIYLTRPPAVFHVAAALLFLALRHRRLAAVALATAAGWFTAVAAFCHSQLDTYTFPLIYSSFRPTLGLVFERLAGPLLSPSRGLLICSPYVVAIAILLVRNRHAVPCPRLLIPTGLAVTGQLLAIGTVHLNMGGACFGPRYFADTMPWFALAAALAVAAVLGAPTAAPRKRRELGALALCFAWALFVHGRGALCPDTWRFNEFARTDAEYEAMSWDMRRIQWLAGLTWDVPQALRTHRQIDQGRND